MKPTLVSSMLAMCGTLIVSSAFAQNYPAKPVRLIVSSSPQGGTDTIARIIGAALTDSLGQPLVIDNRPGANGQIAVTVVAKSPADGYTLLMAGTTSLVIQPLLVSNLPYNTLRDFTPITRVAASDYILAVHPSLPVKTVKDLVAFARAKPGQVAYASAGQGSISHLAGELFKLQAGVDMLHVPYKGGGPAALAILGGEVSLMFGTTPTVVPYSKTGKLRLIATASAKRTKAMPELPTVSETVPGVNVAIWYGMQTPVGTPKEIVTRLHAEIVKAIHTEKVARSITSAGFEPITESPESFTAYLREETGRWAKVIKAAHIRAE